MKKLLSIIGSISIAGSGASVAIACGTSDTTSPQSDIILPPAGDKKVKFTGYDNEHYLNSKLSGVMNFSTPLAQSNPKTVQDWRNQIILKSPSQEYTTENNTEMKKIEDYSSYEAGKSSKKAFEALTNSANQKVANDFPTLDKLVNFLTENNTYLKSSDLQFTQLISPLSETDKATVSKGILHFYGELVVLLGPTLTSQLFSKIDFESTPPEPGVVAQNEFNPITDQQFITFFGSAYANLDNINLSYRLGWWSSDSLLHVFVHEMGHAISNLLWVKPADRPWLNGKGLNDPKNLTLTDLSPNDYIPDFFGNEFNAKEANLKFYIANDLVWSNYGRVSLYNEFRSDSGIYNDTFSESLCEWLLTPNDLQTANWGILNSFYNNYSDPSPNNLFSKFQV